MNDNNDVAAEWRMIRANAAANGRAFCIMVFAACLAVYAANESWLFIWLAMWAAAPVGIAHLTDGGALPYSWAVRINRGLWLFPVSAIVTLFIALGVL